jgi:hypothetical protein
MPPQYKFVEVAPVTDETLGAAVNEWVGKGWQLEGIRFVVTEHSKRPQMAFVGFVRELPDLAEASGDPPATPVATEAQAGPRPLETSEQPPRVLTAAHGDDVE